LRIRGEFLNLDPCIDSAWPRFEIIVRRGGARYEITVDNPTAVRPGIRFADSDGRGIAERPLRFRAAPETGMVDDMARTLLTPLLGKEYDAFLLAAVGEEKNGMTLSLLSAFARLGVDPWAETAALAAMPKEMATRRLTTLIASTTEALATALSSDVVAGRLVALLPDPSRLALPASVSVLAATGAKSSRRFALAGVVIVVLVCLLFYFGAAPWR
jgi:hypothetical protein